MKDVFVYRMGNDDLYDFEGIKNLIGINKSKLQRVLNKIETNPEKYKNRHLYPERTIHEVMEALLLERLKKLSKNELGSN
jgi:hypothetical protein